MAKRGKVLKTEHANERRRKKLFTGMFGSRNKKKIETKIEIPSNLSDFSTQFFMHKCYFDRSIKATAACKND